VVVIVFGGRHHKLPQNKTVQCKLKNKTTERQTNENAFQNNLEKDTENHLLQIKKNLLQSKFICSKQTKIPNRIRLTNTNILLLKKKKRVIQYDLY